MKWVPGEGQFPNGDIISIKKASGENIPEGRFILKPAGGDKTEAGQAEKLGCFILCDTSTGTQWLRSGKASAEKLIREILEKENGT